MAFANNTDVTVVTGACGGMGLACAKAFAAQGRSLILCDIAEQRLEEVASSLRKDAQSVEIFACDISHRDFPGLLGHLIGTRSIGAVVHTAGLSPTMGDVAQMFAVNFDATARLIELVRPKMVEGSCAVMISSSSAYQMKAPEFDAALAAIAFGGSSAALAKLSPTAGHAYALSKRGVLRMVEQQAFAFGQRKARIMSISPGLINTAMGRAEQKAHPQMDELLTQMPLGRYGSADEIASVVIFLCSNDASYLSGSDIKVDGGLIATMGV